MDNPRTFSNIEKFDGVNFKHWKTKIQLVLMQYKVWRLVKGGEPKPEGIDSFAQVIAWNEKNDQALAIIGHALGDNYIHLLNLETTADQVWQHLNNELGTDLSNNILFLKQQFYKMNVANASSLKEHLNAISTLIQQLSAQKCPPDDNDKKAVLLNSLEDHAEYAKVLGGLRTAREMRYEEVVAHVLDHEHRRLQSQIGERIMVARVRPTRTSSSKPSSSTLYCTYCKKNGHTANRCFKRLDDLDAKGGANLVEVHSDEEEDPLSEQAQMACLSIEDDFGLDSWAF